jgi:branched-chain amino acid transport system ATP-binding protein
MLLDEPPSGVATKEKLAVMDLVLAAVSDDRVAVLFVEHDMEIVRRYAERVVVFHEGRVLADDRPDVAFANDEVRSYVTGGHA